MVETSLGIAAAAHISGLFDYLDLDGAMLLADDPFSGLAYEDGRILLSDAPGLGVGPL
jgi:L-Ala-D/L-Glu epimerase